MTLFRQALRVFLSILSKNKIEIRGEVAGGDDYKASLIFDLQKMKFNDPDCSCPYGSYCKHSVALGLKFIDLFGEFFRQANENNRRNNAGDLRKDLIEWINNQDLGQEYAFDEYDENRDSFIKDEYDDEIIEGELEDIFEGKNRTKNELLNKLKKVINAGGASGEEISELLREITYRKPKGREGKSNGSAMIPPSSKSVKKENTLFPEMALEKKEFNAMGFYIVIKNNRYDDSVSNIEIRRTDNSITRPDVILNEYDNLTKNQKKLFKFLKPINSYYGNSINYGKLFCLLRNSEIRTFWDKNSGTEELSFKEEAESEKIKVELNLENRKNYFGEEIGEALVFRLDDEYKKRKTFKLFFDRDYLVKKENKNISFHQLSEPLVKLLSRVSLERYEYYGYGKPFEIELKEEEIIKLDQIIKDGSKYLDLKTNLSPNLQVVKFSSAEPCLLVDYNHKKDFLEVQAAIDYGLEKINVKKSVNRHYSRREDHFQRWNNNKYIIKASAKKKEYALVKSKKEIKLYQQFCYFGREYGFKRNLSCEFNGEKEIFKYFIKHWENVKNLGYKIEFARDEFQLIEKNFEAGFKVDLDAENDWLGFDVNCYCGEDKISLEDLRKYVENKKEFIKLEGGRILKITNKEELERFIFMLESFYAKENNKFEGKLYHATELEDIFTSSKYYNAKIEESFERFIKEVKSGKPIEKIELPKKFDKILRDYQKDGVDWFYFLRKYRFAGILADDMGLGKTLQALVLIEKEKVKNKPSIVICPKTLLYNWQSEVEKFAPKIKAIVIDGFPDGRKKLIKKAKNYDLIITGYATMQKDCEVYDKQKIKFNYCILDEAQFIKNHATKNAQIVKKINADYRLALTGTPLENSVSEIWSIFDFLMPGFLGSYNSFTRKFQNPIMKYSDALALKNLRKKTECFMLRRAKSEVLKELPPKIEQFSHCHLEKAQNILYQEILANVKSEIFETVKNKGFNKSRIHILAGLMKLRQVCNHPVLLLKDEDYTKYESAKLNMFLELIDEIVGGKNKVLVFSQFTKMLDILAKELDKNNISHSYLSGKTQNRQELVDDFNNSDDKQVFLISLKAGGTGLNLTSANNVIIFDPWWNPSVENQAVDRTHRIGQKKSVNVYRLITKGTIEERIVKLQERKKFLFDNLVGESKDLFTKLTWDDIKELFR